MRCPYRDGLRAPLVPQGPGTSTPTDPRPDVLGPDSQLVYQGLSCPSPRPSPLFVCELLGPGDPSCPLSPRATKGLLAGRVAWVSASPSVSPGDGHGCGQAAPARELTGGGSSVPAGSVRLAQGRILGFPLTVGGVQGFRVQHCLALGWGHSWVCRGGWGGRAGQPVEQRRVVGKTEGDERWLE